MGDSKYEEVIFLDKGNFWEFLDAFLWVKKLKILG